MDLENIKFDNMTEKQKVRALACQTPEEMLAFAREEGFERSDALSVKRTCPLARS